MKLFRIVHFLVQVFEILTLFRCPGFFVVLGLVTVKFAYDDFTTSDFRYSFFKNALNFSARPLSLNFHQLSFEMLNLFFLLTTNR